MTDEQVTPDGYEAVLGGDIDVAEVAGLVDRVEQEIDGISRITESFIQMVLEAPGADTGANTLLLRDAATGDLAGFGLHHNPEPHVESVTSGWVDPEHVSRGLGSAIVTWGLDRAHRQIPLAPPGSRVQNRCQASDADAGAGRLFTDLGFHSDRHEIELQLVLDAAVEVASPPDGVTLRTMTGARDLPIVAGVITEAFKDHYGWVESSDAQTMERWAIYRAMDEWDDELVLIAEAPDGVVGAIVGLRSFGKLADVGFIGSLGVIRRWRGKGVARALLTAAFDRYQQRGLRGVALDVDADNLTGATKLYESVGMRPAHTQTAYLIELRPGTDLVTR